MAALREYELAVEAAPSDVIARRKVGDLAAKLGLIQDAIKAYQLLAGRHPTAPGRVTAPQNSCRASASTAR